MGLFRFILGVLGVVLIIGAVSSFIPLFFLGGIATGSVAFAIGFPIFLIITGAIMIYYGFYKTETREKSNQHLIDVAKWGILYTLAILLGNFVISKLMIANTLLTIILTATMVSFVAQIVRSHETEFKWKWFIFYFLVYAIIIWAVGEFIVPNVSFQTGLFSSLVAGFAIAGMVIIIQKLNMRHHSVQWSSVVLVIVLIVANLGSLQIANLKPLMSVTSNSSVVPQDKQVCPISISDKAIIRPYGTFEPISVGKMLNGAINTSVWRIEENVRTCYNGKYTDQRPDWIYCDDMVVSRWETSGSGKISYRWYTAVTFEWQPLKDASANYILNTISCENGQKVTVNKETTAYYVHVSRDGTEIKIQY